MITIFAERGGEEPHALFAVTDIVPPEELAVVVMLLVVLLPVHPAGSVQV